MSSTALTSPSLYLGGSALGTLLANFLGLTPSGVGSGLCLFSLLLGLSCGLLLFALFDSGRAGGVAGFGTLGTALLDHIEGGTNNSTLVLDGTTSTFLGNFLFACLLALLAIEVVGAVYRVLHVRLPTDVMLCSMPNVHRPHQNSSSL
jgi:hypothetical protein